jgi:signal-transduction protein with cAMP-binding, CBS, and nucleotidyltransferase domain
MVAHAYHLAETLHHPQCIGALSYLMELRLRSQLRAMKSGAREAEAIVRISELSTGDRDLLRNRKSARMMATSSITSNCPCKSIASTLD